MKQIEILIENNSQKISVEKGTSASQIIETLQLNPNDIVAVHIDGTAKALDYEINTNCTLHYISKQSTEGSRIYASSIILLLQRAVRDTLGHTASVDVMHTTLEGYYIKIEPQNVTAEQLSTIESRMQQYVSSSSPIKRQRLEFNEALSLLESQGQSDKVALLRSRSKYWMDIYYIENLESEDKFYGYFYSPLVLNCAELNDFTLSLYGDGIILHTSTNISQTPPPAKLHDIFSTNSQWLDIMEFDNIGSLNQKIQKGEGSTIIHLAEALQEKNFSLLADAISNKHKESGLKVIFISGPSSSGKTTFAKRLSIQLSVLGLTPMSISLDDYFVDREFTPRDSDGNLDFEALEAVNVPRFNNDLKTLLDGGEVELPRFDFKNGASLNSGKTMRLNDGNILLIEGIHALNPTLSHEISKDEKFLVYVSALTTLSIDKTSLIHTSDNRLLRRMVRDYNFRGRDAQTTLNGWSSVRRGEKLHIFPYQENADYMFNTALVFEFSILRHYAEPLLRSVPTGCAEHYDARRLLTFLELFDELPVCDLPGNSLFREFLGGSSFHY